MQVSEGRCGVPESRFLKGMVTLKGPGEGGQSMGHVTGEGNGIFDEAGKAYSGHGEGYIG